MKSRILLVILLFTVAMTAEDEKPYTGPSEEDVIVLDGDNL